MRLAGWFLLLAGLLLCLTVAWATIGFLLMGVGLIALRSAERRRQRPPAPEVVASDVAMPLAVTAVVETAADAPVASPDVQESRDPAGRRRAASDPLRDPVVASARTIDTVRWHVLLRKDPEIARLAEILTPYGAGYVEQLASDYLDVGDKSALPAILERIIARARAEKEEAERVVALPPVDAPHAEAKAEPQRAAAEKPTRREPVFDTPVTATVTATALTPVVAAATPAVAVPVTESPIAVIASQPKSASEAIEPMAPAPEIGEATASGLTDLSAGRAEPQMVPQPLPARAATITASDDALAELIEKFAPDSGFLRGGLNDPKPV